MDIGTPMIIDSDTPDKLQQKNAVLDFRQTKSRHADNFAVVGHQIGQHHHVTEIQPNTMTSHCIHDFRYDNFSSRFDAQNFGNIDRMIGHSLGSIDPFGCNYRQIVSSFDEKFVFFTGLFVGLNNAPFHRRQSVNNNFGQVIFQIIQTLQMGEIFPLGWINDDYAVAAQSDIFDTERHFQLGLEKSAYNRCRRNFQLQQSNSTCRQFDCQEEIFRSEYCSEHFGDVVQSCPLQSTLDQVGQRRAAFVDQATSDHWGQNIRRSVDDLPNPRHTLGDVHAGHTGKVERFQRHLGRRFADARGRNGAHRRSGMNQRLLHFALQFHRVTTAAHCRPYGTVVVGVLSTTFGQFDHSLHLHRLSTAERFDRIQKETAAIEGVGKFFHNQTQHFLVIQSILVIQVHISAMFPQMFQIDHHAVRFGVHRINSILAKSELNNTALGIAHGLVTPLHVTRLGSFHGTVDQSFSTGHGVEEKLTRFQAGEKARFDETSSNWRFVIFHEMRQRPTLKAFGWPTSGNRLLTNAGDHLADVDHGPFGTAHGHCQRRIVHVQLVEASLTGLISHVRQFPKYNRFQRIFFAASRMHGQQARLELFNISIASIIAFFN
ncbi:hypothetical protein T06_3029 [Trichinella sp. T6]|nr:hypothetical protein T06_3029 [Trichinella sp. T6]